MNISFRTLLIAGVAASCLTALALPSLALAATYAYVNQAREVSTVNANDWQTALLNATNIDEHSGVLLLTPQNSAVVGTTI
jgi:hypothetical protein